ncbi:MAG: bifunctional riboflavin kinase/FAD synthetase [Stappiaceae bacterium]
MPASGNSVVPSFTVVGALDEFPQALFGGVVAIGNFDGVHRGHRAVLNAALDQAKQNTRPAYIMTFEPHPRTVFRPEHPVFRLTPPNAKADLLHALGFAGMLVVPFNRDFASITAQDFVQKILCAQLGISHAVIGYDFHFGKARQGTPNYLEEAGGREGFGVSIVQPFEDENAEIVSSSRIREALSAGDIILANSLLGYRWFVDGTVQHGEKRGREMGFPTANLTLPPECRLRHGIYAVRTYVAGKRYDGVASYGRRPTFDNGTPLLEVFIFDFSDDIYGQPIRISFASHLRPELKFDDVPSLIEQMNRDSAEARAILDSLKPLSDIDVHLDEQMSSY